MKEVWILTEGNRWLKAEVYASEQKAIEQVLRGSPEARFSYEGDILYAYIEGDPHNAPAYTIVKYDVR